MSIGQVAAGQFLDGRYRLIEPLPPDAGAWRAHDETLARDVAIHLLPLDDPRCGPLRDNARAAGRLTGQTPLRVYDVAEGEQLLFVVSEILDGDTLERRLLTGGPLPPDQACEIVLDVAQALIEGAAAGLTHGHLRPSDVVFAATGEPRVDGLGVAAAWTSAAPESARGADERALGYLLYAALTARWPGPDADSALPAPPTFEDRTCTPRQVRAGVPRELDALTMRMLAGIGISEAAALLRPFRNPPEQGHPFEQAAPPGLLAELTGTRPGNRRRTPTSRWGLPVAVVAIVAIGIALAAALSPGEAGTPAATPSPPLRTGVVDAPQPGTGTPLALATVRDFDPLGDGSEHPEEVALAHDGDPATAWHTSRYTTAALGDSKTGVGLLVDLGTERPVKAVNIDFGISGVSFELRAGDADPATDTDLAVMAADTNAPSSVTVRLPPETTDRYWLVWLTSLPRVGPGDFQGSIAEINLTG